VDHIDWLLNPKLRIVVYSLAGLCLAAHTSVFAQVDVPIYNDSLVNGWLDWSSATVNLTNTQPVHSGADSISVSAGPWQAIYAAHDVMNTSGFTNLVFWINGGASGGQHFQIAAILDWNAQPAIALPPLPTNSWQQITISLALLGVANQRNFTGFWIQDSTGTNQPTFYVDDISLIAVPVPSVVNVKVNAGSAIRTVDARHFGVNTGVWDNQLDKSTTISLLNSRGTTALRFPGGSLSDDLDWTSNKAGGTTYATTFHQFAQVATSLVAQVFITVNYGSATPALAAEWVSDSNVTNHYGFKYWEIGNEIYGSWETDSNNLPHDPYTYANRFAQYYSQMKAVDPTIKIGAVSVPGEDSYANYTNHPVVNPVTGQTHNGWTPVMLATLKSLGVMPDFLIHHRYPQAPGSENDDLLLISSSGWANDAGDLRTQLTDYLGTAGAGVELTCTENNSVYSGPGKQTTSLVNGLFLADSLGQLLQTEFNALMWWDLREGQNTGNNNSSWLYGWRLYGDYGVMDSVVPPAPADLYPAYYVGKMLQYFARPGDQVVSATSDYVGLAAYAVKRTNGVLSVLFINKHPSSNLVANVTLSGYSPASNAVMYSYGIPQDNAAKTGSGSADVSQTALTIPGPTFGTSFGPYSGSVLALGATVATAPQVVSNSLALVIESCTNNAVDPGETVTMNFGLINIGSANTTNLVATLEPTGGVTSPSGAQTYGVLTASGPAVVRPFSFTASGTCGGVVTATLQLQDGASNLGLVSFSVQLGSAISGTPLSETFDSVTAPALPTGWVTAVISGQAANWSTTNGFSDSAPNSAFAPDAATAGETVLLSPSIPVASSSAQLTFRQNYRLASRTPHPRSSTTYYDGGVLEISIGGGAFTDILTAGGSFAAGGYNCTLATGTGNPLVGSRAWGGSSGGWITTTVNLPAAAAGNNIQLRWSCGTGVNTSVATGWFIDTVSVQDNSFQCCSSSADVGVTQTVALNPGVVGQNLSYNLAIANAGPFAASSVAVTDSLPNSVTFVSASPGCVNLGGSIACTIGTLASGTTSNIVVTVKPGVEGTITNSVSVTSMTLDPNVANNLSVSTTAIYVAPSITAQPTNLTTSVGGSANFYVTAAGTAPLSYQWTFGGIPISGATTTTLGLANVQAGQAGNYAVVVTNSASSVTSAVATLTVLVPPSITAQPTNQTVVVGAKATFQVGAAGTSPLGYQWLFNGAKLAGATTNALTLNNVQTSQAGGYSVVVTNGAGSITSAEAGLTALVPPSITLQPSNQTAVVGDNVNFQAAASSSTPLSYQWFFGATPLPGATATTLGLSNVQTNQAGNYSFVATNEAGAATSVVAQLTVLVPPSISGEPSNQTAIAGSTVSFQVNASGTSLLSYQWWFNGTNAVGTSTNLLTLINAQTNQAGSYCVTVTNVAGSVTSTVATLIVGTPPSITQQPSSQQVVQGQDATFNIGVSGDTPLSYQWRFNGVVVSGGTVSAYTVAAATGTNAGNYDVIVTNSYGSVTSAVAQLTILVPPTITSQPTNQNVAVGGSVTFQVTAAGSSPLGYQWWFNGTNAVGTGTNWLNLQNVQTNQAGTYIVVVTNAAGALTSSPAILTIGTPPSITQQPSGTTIVQGQSATFNVVANGGTPLSYQWRFNGALIGNATSSSYIVAAATSASAGNYDVVITNSYGNTTSSPSLLRVLVPPTITGIQPSTAAVSISVSSLNGLSYQLEYKNNLSDPAWTAASPWVPGSGTTLVLQDTNAVAALRFYRVNCE
jgi:uncharacterized repeat protein (TIGR01451 family)